MSEAKQVSVGPGTVVASYRIVGTLGVGGSGTVYRAEHVDSGHAVALKVMNAEHLDDATERQRFEREAEVVKKLAHPHVVGLLDYGYADDLPYLVFPLLEGHTLEQRLNARGKLDWALTARLSVQVLSALEVAHGMGIAHRDIKPANIFLCESPLGEIAQILDFGTAKIVGDAGQRSDVTRVGVLVGTPRYMAPEQVRGEPLTPAADVYAFGLVMAEMILGEALV
ncbi:MAG TPA: serine/threonine-protein kinase, partial [Byssovorax sp.]